VPGEGKALREKWIDSGSESGMTQNCHAELVSASSNRGSLPKCHCEERSDEAIQETKFSVGKINTKTELLTFGLPRFARNDKRAAFTLAEVLITLAIIGVVAAMTIPTLIRSYQEKVTVTKVKKAYSVLTNALRLAVIENGTVDNWGIGSVYYTEGDDGNSVANIPMDGSANLANMFAKYLKTTEICTGKKECSELKNTKTLSGTFLNQDSYAYGSSYIKLIDGTLVMFTPWEGKCLRVNGPFNDVCGSVSVLTEPEKDHWYGVNFFTFALRKNALVPWGAPVYTGNASQSLANKCVYNGTNSENGLGCTGWIIEVGNMDYLHCDGLSYDGKRKCN